jgi:hypothetical protein
MTKEYINDDLPLAANYINGVIEAGEYDRAGHHNYVVEQAVLNTIVPIADMTTQKLKLFDKEMVAFLERLDICH